jgi:hypothetical protein
VSALDDAALLDPFAVTHAAGRPPAAAPGFLGEKLSAILRAGVAGGGEQDRPVGTSEQRDRASDLLRRESECCCLNESGLLERERVVLEGEDRDGQ